MIIGQVQAAAPQAAPGMQGAAVDGSGFAPMLVSQVGTAASGNANAANAQSAGQLAAAGIISGELAALLTGSTDEGLMAKLDELLAMLQEGDDELQLNAEAMLQLEQTLNELQTMMLGLFGITLLPTAIQPERQMSVPEGESGGAGKAGSIDRLLLAETLTFLKSFLQEGQAKTMGKEQSAQFNLQLDQLKQIIQKGTKQPDGAFALAGETVEATAAAGANPSSALLHRLGGQPLHPSVLQVVVTEAASGQQATQAGAVSQIGENAVHGNLTVQAPVAEAAKLAEAPKAAAQPAVPVSRFAELVTGMTVKQFGLTQSNGVSEARITLLPEHLGQVDVKITVHNGQLTALFVTDNAAAREMLENQLAVLRNSLQSQGLQVEKLEVTHNPFQSEAFQEQRGRGNNGQASHGQDQKGGGADGDAGGFESELLEKVAMDGLGYGRGINVTA